MGKGLDIMHAGTHIAFTAGTGCLVFVDLVAHLIRKNLNLLPEHEDSQLSRTKFKFVFYVSFRDKDSGIAVDLLQGCQELARKTEMNNFEFEVRYSQESRQRWDRPWIINELKKHQADLKKVWVCGPPKMN